MSELQEVIERLDRIEQRLAELDTGSNQPSKKVKVAKLDSQGNKIPASPEVAKIIKKAKRETGADTNECQQILGLTSRRTRDKMKMIANEFDEVSYITGRRGKLSRLKAKF